MIRGNSKNRPPRGLGLCVERHSWRKERRSQGVRRRARRLLVRSQREEAAGLLQHGQGSRAEPDPPSRPKVPVNDEVVSNCIGEASASVGHSNRIEHETEISAMMFQNADSDNPRHRHLLKSPLTTGAKSRLPSTDRKDKNRVLMSINKTKSTAKRVSWNLSPEQTLQYKNPPTESNTKK